MHPPSKTKTKPLKTLLEQLAKEHGIVHQAGPRIGQVNVTALAKRLRMHQPTVQRYMRGQITSPSLDLLRGLYREFRVGMPELLGEQEDPTQGMTSSARLMAEKWDTLPPTLRQYMQDVIAAYDLLVRSNPGLASLLFTPPGRLNYPEIEKWQIEHQRPPKPP